MLTVFVAASITRAGALLWWIGQPPSARPRYTAFVGKQLGLALCDWVTAVPLCLTFVAHWRFRRLQRRWLAMAETRLGTRNVGWEVFMQVADMHAAVAMRLMVLHEAVHTVLDLPFFVTTLPVFLTVYRAPSLLRALYAETEVANLRHVCLAHFGQWLLDVPFLAMGAVVTTLLWRAFPLWRRLLASGSSAESRRRAASFQFLLLIVDAVTLVGAIVPMLIIPHRLPSTVHRLVAVYRGQPDPRREARNDNDNDNDNDDHDDDHDDDDQQGDGGYDFANESLRDALGLHRVVWSGAWDTVLDLPFVLMGLAAACAIWRLPLLVRDLRNTTTGRQRRRVASYHFVHIFTDLLGASLVVPVMLTVWRVPMIWVRARRRLAVPRAERTRFWKLDLAFSEASEWLKVGWLFLFFFFFPFFFLGCF